MRVHSSEKPKEEIAPLTNPFVQFLTRSGGDVTIVEPDTSLAMIQEIVGANVTLSDYIGKDFAQRQVAIMNDPAKQRMILSLSDYRTTSANEARIADTSSKLFGRSAFTPRFDMPVTSMSKI